jgi:very-short-patch-repair endonuclease
MVMTKLTREVVVAKCIAVHGNKYDYSKLIWVDVRTPVEILCTVHGSFWQLYSTHSNKARGCRKCGNKSKRLTREQAIERFQKVHGSKYDYSKVELIDTTTAVIIGCPDHGDFKLAPVTHWGSKQAICPKCKKLYSLNNKTLTQDECIERFVDAHGKTYDYSEVEYVKSNSLVKIACSIHGLFEQKPASHWKGSKCPKCRGLSLEECLRRFRLAHGDRYDYSKVHYVSPQIPVIVVCPKHGDFSTLPANHWLARKHSCSPCRHDARKMTEEDITARFRKVHGDTYEYPKFIYENIFANILIVCRKHGEFNQSINNHMRGTGCPSCWQNTSSAPELEWGESISFILGVEFLKTQRPLGGRWGGVDFVFKLNNFKFVLEYDGQYWHSRDNSLDKDTRKTKELVNLGYQVIRLREQESTNRLPRLIDVPLATNITVSSKLSDLQIRDIISIIKDLAGLEKNI